MALRQLRGSAFAPSTTRSKRKTWNFDTVLAQCFAPPMDTSEVTPRHGIWSSTFCDVPRSLFTTSCCLRKFRPPLAVSDGKIKVPSGLGFRVTTCHVSKEPPPLGFGRAADRPPSCEKAGGFLPARRKLGNARTDVSSPATGKRSRPNGSPDRRGVVRPPRCAPISRRCRPVHRAERTQACPVEMIKGQE
jgi:hypothetical protein